MPVFFIVIVLGDDVVPTFTVPKLSHLGDTDIFGAAVVPESFTFKVAFLGSLEKILMAALFLPNVEVDLNSTTIVHELPGEIVEQEFV